MKIKTPPVWQNKGENNKHLDAYELAYLLEGKNSSEKRYSELWQHLYSCSQCQAEIKAYKDFENFVLENKEKPKDKHILVLYTRLKQRVLEIVYKSDDSFQYAPIYKNQQGVQEAPKGKIEHLSFFFTIDEKKRVFLYIQNPLKQKGSICVIQNRRKLLDTDFVQEDIQIQVQMSTFSLQTKDSVIWVTLIPEPEENLQA